MLLPPLILNFTQVTHHIDMKYLSIVFVKCSSSCIVQEGWKNFNAVHCTHIFFYGEIFVEPNSLIQPTKGLGSMWRLYIKFHVGTKTKMNVFQIFCFLLVVMIVEPRYLNLFSWICTWLFILMPWPMSWVPRRSWFITYIYWKYKTDIMDTIWGRLE